MFINLYIKPVKYKGIKYKIPLLFLVYHGDRPLNGYEIFGVLERELEWEEDADFQSPTLNMLLE